MRRKFAGQARMPKIGYGSNKKTRFMLPNGLKKITISNARELEVLLMNNRTHCAEIAHNVSAMKKKSLVERAKELNVHVTNPNVKVRKAESEKPAAA